MWAPSAWFRVEADLIDMTEQPTRSEGKTYQYILQGCVEQAHNAIYSYLHHLRSFRGDGFNWAELLPSVTYMHNTAV
jgi:hypothetical protein